MGEPMGSRELSLRRGKGAARSVWRASLAFACALALVPATAAGSPAPDASTAADAIPSGLQPDAFGSPVASRSPARTEAAPTTTPLQKAPATGTVSAPPGSTPSSRPAPTSQPATTAAAPAVHVSEPLTPSAASPVSVPLASPPAEPVVSTPTPATEKPAQAHVEVRHRAARARVPIPADVRGIARSFVASSSTSSDFAAADALRPAALEPLVTGGSRLALASLALLLLVAASGSFLLLVHRASRAGSPTTS
jgi:hypothetical protein